MKRALSAGVGLIALAIAVQPSVAADLPAKAPVYTKAPPAATLFNWTQCHAGLNGGWGWGESTGERGATTLVGAGLAVTPSDFALKPDGAIGGGQLGCDWQNGSSVFGWEADFQASRIRDQSSFLLASGAELASSTASHDLDWFGTVRIRVGVTSTPNLLLYVTGGLAYGSVHDRATINGLGAGLIGTFSASGDGVRFGWTVGAGGEFALPDDWSVKAEYLYVDLGSRTLHTTNPIFPASVLDYRFDHRYHVARLGLNKRFSYNPPPVTVRR